MAEQKTALREEFNWDDVGAEWIPLKVMFPPDTGVSEKTNRAWFKVTIYGKDGQKPITMWLRESVYDLMKFLGFKSGTEFEIADKGSKLKGKWRAKYLIRMNGDDEEIYNPMDETTWGEPEDETAESPEMAGGDIGFKEIARTVWDTAYAWITDGVEQITEEQRVQAKLALIKDCSTMVNTLVMVNGGKK